jgi:hypothetical protein
MAGRCAQVREIEQRQIAPLVARANTLMTRVDAILGDLRDVTARVSTRTERVGFRDSTDDQPR